MPDSFDMRVDNPATTLFGIRQDTNGVPWVAFEYSLSRGKTVYTIRCDVECVNVDTLSTEFKINNCIYRRAHRTENQYKGNYFDYETECNRIG